MTPEERTLRQRLPNAWLEAAWARDDPGANGRARTIPTEKEKARLVIGEFDSAGALRDRHYRAQAHVDAGDRVVNHDGIKQDV